MKGNPFYVKYIKGDPTTFDYTFDTIPTKGGLKVEFVAPEINVPPKLEFVRFEYH